MDEEVNSESTSTIGEDWVRDGDVAKDVISSPSQGSQSSETDVRKVKWAKLLGVSNRPNPLEDWDNLYNLNSQSTLRNDCRKLAKAIDNKKSVPELESFMTLFCKKRNTDYKKDCGWMDVFEKMLKCDISSEHLFNVFFSFATKYIPKETNEGSHVYDLFRLILQYHDPDICTHLDSLKLSPFTYAQQWFSTLFASELEDVVCSALWDGYIEKGDPFLIFYMSLSLIINARDQLFAIQFARREEALKLIQSLPKQLTAEDISDFVQISTYYLDRTPQSIQEDYTYMLFGANYEDDNERINISRMICLPVTIQELLRNQHGASLTGLSISYFIIDCRRHDAFVNGHIYGSFNLDCQLCVDAPSQFEFALTSLNSYKNDQKFEEHISFIGYGSDDEDQYMHMVIARFLREGKKNVSVARGGYRVLHTTLAEADKLRIINSHNESKCTECNRGKTRNWNLVDKMKEVVISKSSAVKEKVSTLVSSPSSTEYEIRHLAEGDRHGKRYRNEPSAFSIEDESDDDDGGTIYSKKEDKVELLLADQAEYIDKYECMEICGTDEMKRAYIAITRTHIHILHEVPKKANFVTTEARYALSTVLRVTSKRNVPELLTFKFGYEINGETKVTAVHKFLVTKAGECAKSVKQAIFALRPLSE